MDVRELIAKLEALPEEQKDLPVYTEGCDCSGPANGVEVHDTPGYTQCVEITRDHSK